MKTNYNPLINPFNGMEDEDFVREIESRYEMEDKLYIAISQGLPDLVDSILSNFNNRPVEDTFHYIIGGSLGRARVFCRVLNISGRIAARSGGLSPIYLHNISEQFGIVINETTDINFLRDILPKTIAKEYAKTVAEFSTSKYSPLVSKAAEYIGNHLTEPLESIKIAKLLYVSPEHLSRKFKADTGKNIPDYINFKRISMAKILLSRNAKNLTEVAIQVGYTDSSYFSKAFKKVEGITPKEYLTQSRNIK